MTRFLAATLALVPLVSARAQPPASPLDAAPSRFATLDGSKVHYKSLGDGPAALVLVHGWSCDLTFWRAQVPAFAGKARLVLIDLPGHGKSDRPEVNYTMDLFARAVAAVLKDAGVERAVLAGHSMGTPVVRQVYRLHPQKVLGLVAVDGALRRFAVEPAQLDQFLAPFQEPHFAEGVGKFVDAMFTPQTPAEIRTSVKETMQKATPRVALSAMRGMFDPAVWAEDKIDVPVQLILARSPFWEGDYREYVKRLAPKAEFHVVEGAGHFLMLEKPEAVNGLLAGFLRTAGVLKP
jgi:pimeloyl-ACP methyl ester carboxylesterase